MKEKLYEVLFFIGLTTLIVSVSITFGPGFHSFTAKDIPTNLEVEIASGYKEILPGEELWFSVKFLNLANKDRIDVTLRYDMIDPDEKLVASKSETVAVETQASFVGKMAVPEDAQIGHYFLRASLVPVDETIEIAEAEALFRVKNEEQDLTIYYAIGISIVGIAVVVFLVYRGKYLLARIRMRRKIHRIVRRRLH